MTIDDNAIKTPSLPKNTKTYLTDNDGNPTKVMTTSTWDTVNELAYTEPVKAGKPIWVRIYTYYDPAYPLILWHRQVVRFMMPAKTDWCCGG